MINVRRWGRRGRLVALLAGLLTVTVGPVLAQPASATPVCTGVSSISHGSLAFSIPTYGSGTGNVSCSMQRGTNSSAVRSLQNNLNLCYWSGSNSRGHLSAFGTRLVEDGDFGGNTEAALRKVQAYHGISADGQYGPQTRRTINFFADDGLGGRCARFGA